MANCSILVLFTVAVSMLCLLSPQEASAQYSVNVDLSKEVAQIGDDVEVTCTVLQDQMVASDSAFLHIIWVKRVGTTYVEIGLNNYINNDFKNVGRYSGDVDYEYDSANEVDFSKVTFLLKIKGVRPEDSGEIGCRIPQQNIEVFRQLTVSVPVKSILMNSLDMDGTHAQSYVDRVKVIFDDGHVMKFYCHVNGSFPKPHVAITIGNKDITNMFEREVKVFQKGSVKGLDAFVYAVTLKNEAFTIDYSFANKTLECKATLPESGSPAKTIGINIKLAGYPNVTTTPGTRGITNNVPNTNNFINDDNKNLNFIYYTLIIIISVSIGGFFLNIVVIVRGITCYKNMETKRAQTLNSNPNLIPLAPMEPNEVTPPFAPTSTTGQTGPTGPTEPGPVYYEEIKRGPPSVRPAAKLAIHNDVNHQLPAIPPVDTTYMVLV